MASQSLRVLLAATAGLAALTGTPAHAAAAPAVTVSPATGLGDGQVVTVQGTGFTPGKTLTVGQCEMDLLFCNLDQDLDVVADAQGAFTTQLPVRKAYHGVNPKDNTEAQVDCGAQTCAVAAVDPNDPGENVEYAVSESLVFS